MALNTAEVKALHKNLSASKLAIISEALSIAPTLKASLDSGWLISERPVEFSTEIMLRIELPLFSGGSSIAQLKNLRAQRTINELNLRQKKRKNMYMSLVLLIIFRH